MIAINVFVSNPQNMLYHQPSAGQVVAHTQWIRSGPRMKM